MRLALLAALRFHPIENQGCCAAKIHLSTAHFWKLIEYEDLSNGARASVVLCCCYVWGCCLPADVVLELVDHELLFSDDGFH